MNIEKIFDYLQEEFVDYLKSNGGKKTNGIYKNITSRELRDLTKEEETTDLRFVIDKKTKDIYVFSSNNLLHQTVVTKLFGNSADAYDEKKFIVGVANNNGTVKGGLLGFSREIINFLKPWFDKKSALSWKELQVGK